MIKRTKKIMATALSALLAISPISYGDQVSGTAKEEVVYINLRSDGQRDRVYVVSIFDLPQDQRIIDYGNYSKVTNLSSVEEINQQQDQITIDAKKGRLYYEGELNQQEIPWNFQFKYFLNGIEKKAAELAGKSGQLVIQMKIQKNEEAEKGFFESYALQVNFEFDSSKVTLQSAEGGTIANVGKNKQVSYIVLPNSEEEFEISTQVNHFEMAPITMGGVKLSMDLEKEFEKNKSLEQDMNQLKTGVADLDDGAKKLSDGAGKLKDGVGDVQSGAKDLKDGAKKLSDGSLELTEGTLELKKGASDLTKGVDDLKGGSQKLREGSLDILVGTGKLDDGSQKLVEGGDKLHKGSVEYDQGVNQVDSGLREFHQGINAAVNGTGQSDPNTGMPDLGIKGYVSGVQQLVAILEKLAPMLALGKQLEAQKEAALGNLNEQLKGMTGTPLTPENYTSILQGIIDRMPVVSYDEVAGQMNEAANARVAVIIQAVEGKPGTTLSVETKVALEEALAKALAPTHEEIAAAVQGQMLQKQMLQSALDQLTQLDVILAQLQALQASSGSSGGAPGDMNAQLQALKAGGQRITAGLDQLVETSSKLSGGTGELKKGSSDLANGILEYEEGVKKYREGVGEFKKGYSSFHDGVVQLDGGIFDLQSGMIKFREGVIKLHDGATELHKGTDKLTDGTSDFYTGTKDLYEGANSLYDGTKELKEGTGEFRDKTSNIDGEMKEKIKEAIQQMMGGDKAPESFVSSKNKVTSLQFVIKTPKIELPDVGTAPPVEKQMTFWQKVLNLFGLYKEDK